MEDSDYSKSIEDILKSLRESGAKPNAEGEIAKYKYVRKNDLLFRPLPPKLFDLDK